MKQIIFIAFLCFSGIQTYAFSDSQLVINAQMIADTTFKAYAGVYKLAENGLADTYIVTYEDGKLYGQAAGYDKTELTKQTTNHSFKSGYGSDVIFIQEAADKPFLKVKLIVQGNEVMGEKK
jgi:hypothetical protein